MRTTQRRASLAPGGQFVEHVVNVTADGFDWQGRPYKSLSAIARAITGTRWNGWVFFGVRGARARTRTR
jgi:hypothetical protein